MCVCRCWALALFGGNSETGFDQNTTYSIFSISITLTNQGFQNFYQVCPALRGVSPSLSHSLTYSLTLAVCPAGGGPGLPVSEDAADRGTTAEVRLGTSTSTKLKSTLHRHHRLHHYVHSEPSGLLIFLSGFMRRSRRSRPMSSTTRSR